MSAVLCDRRETSMVLCVCREKLLSDWVVCLEYGIERLICCMIGFCVCRENELLKHQLKKYVSAVQMLRRQGATAEGLLSHAFLLFSC